MDLSILFFQLCNLRNLFCFLLALAAVLCTVGFNLFGVGTISGFGSLASGVYNTAENISKTNRQIRTAQKNFRYNIY